MTLRKKDNYKLWDKDEVEKIKAVIQEKRFSQDQDAIKHLAKELDRNIGAVRSKYSKIKKELNPDSRTRTWEREEIELLKSTIEDQLYPTDKEAIQALADILGRSYNAVNYKYYDVKRKLTAGSYKSMPESTGKETKKDKSRSQTLTAQIDETIEELEFLREHITRCIDGLKETKKNAHNIELWIADTLKIKNQIYATVDRSGVVTKLENR